jgi:hypothetical protein
MDIGIPLTVVDAITALSRLNMRLADDPDEAADEAIKVLKVLNGSKNQTIRNLANEGLFQMHRQKVVMHL